MLRFCAILFILSAFLVLPASAQRSNRGLNADGDLLSGSNSSSGGIDRRNAWAVAINAGYENPDKTIRNDYKAAPTFGLTVIKHLNNWMISVGVDHRAYKPKYPVVVGYDSYWGNFQRLYDNFKGTGIYAGIAYDLPVSDLFDVYGGLNFGSIIITRNEAITSQALGLQTLSATTSVGYVGPKLGFNIATGSNLNVGIEGRYGLSTSSVNSNTGLNEQRGFSSASVNLMLIYNF